MKTVFAIASINSSPKHEPIIDPTRVIEPAFEPVVMPGA